MTSKDMLASIPGSIIILQNIFPKYVKFFLVVTHDPLVKEEEHDLIMLFCWKTIQKEDFSTTKSSSHLKAILMRTNARMEEALSSAELLNLQEKQQTKETLFNKTH